KNGFTKFSDSTILFSSYLGVFLSYRGPDTGPNFTAHLYAALDRHRIKTYKDDYKLRQGEVITEALKKAIKASKIYIVVFSKDYASSPWCLDELVDIVSFHEKEERLIIPVFYHIDPSVVRHVGIEKEEKESSIYDKALQRHAKGYYKNEELRVKSWLYALKVAANISGNHICEKNREEPDVIEIIVAEISPRINPKSFDEKTVGLELRIESIVAMLSSGRSTGVTKIGIHGMGGVGKTTLARAVFDKIYFDFKGSCFLANVTANSGTDEGMKSLQQQLLNDVLFQNEKDVKDVASGIKLIETKLADQKILVVIDDLNHSDQLESFGVKSFGHGSVVIITTREEDMLKYFEVKTEHRYMVDKLGCEESLILFQQHAFRFGSNPDGALMKLSKDITLLADGLPLALKVFGSLLHTKYEVEEWEEFIERLKETPNREIEDSLLISFQAINGDLQKMFLDIACFFIGWGIEKVFQILETYYSYVKVKINNLKGKCLLTIDDKNVLHMHDLLRDMGMQVARNNSPGNPEKYSRLWLSRDIDRVLTEENKVFQKLKILNMEYSSDLMTTPDFNMFPSLVDLNFAYCRSLKKIHRSIGRLAGLVSLNLGGCWMLASLPKTIGNLKALKHLNLFGSASLGKLPENLPESLENLNIGMSGLKSLPHSIHLLGNLIELDVPYNSELITLPDNICKLRSLQYLIVSACKNLKALPEDLGDITSLRVLRMKETSVSDLPGSIGNLSNLVELILGRNPNLETLADTICNLRSLEILTIGSCEKLKELPGQMWKITSLRELCIRNTTMLKVEANQIPISLKKLDLSYKAFTTLPLGISRLTNLECLQVEGCSQLLSIEELPPNLKRLYASGCPSMTLEQLELLKLKTFSGLEVIV
ncbi:disease resistance protein RPV1-like, partial [Daucus carota subsp. sativus]|uniref:disease resistance protein RPV1-like n=1 Tax=Daucus carota subsp. sativus TaxID=79200 RepID=UPI003083D4E5